jgi:hypothetical protein
MEAVSPMMGKRMPAAASNHQLRHLPGLFSPPNTTAAGSFALVPAAAPAVAADPSLSSSRFWVCVNGLDPTIQEGVLARFASYGRILRQKPAGVNAVALLYENPLHASKALCQPPFQVEGRYIGVFSLSEGDAAALMSSAIAPMLPSSGQQQQQQGAASFLFAPAPAAQSHGNVAQPDGKAPSTDADDIFLRYRRGSASSVRAKGPDGAADRDGLCLRIVRWLLSVD